MAEPTDAEAIAASLDDPRAFVTVFERHFDAIVRYLRRRRYIFIVDLYAASDGDIPREVRSLRDRESVGGGQEESIPQPA